MTCRWPISILAVVVASCSSLADPDENGRVLGILVTRGDSIRIEVPDTVARGTDFTAKVFTYSVGCMSKSDTELRLVQFRATITPYDRVLNVPCVGIFHSMDHSMPLRFDRAGLAEVVVRGVRLPSRDVITVRRSVVVQ
jgi:hypothetical protein